MQEDVPLDLGNRGSRGHAIAPGVEAMSSLSLPQARMYLFILTWLATFLGLKKVWLNKCYLLVLFHHLRVLERVSTSLTSPTRLSFSRRRPPA